MVVVVLQSGEAEPSDWMRALARVSGWALSSSAAAHRAVKEGARAIVEQAPREKWGDLLDELTPGIALEYFASLGLRQAPLFVHEAQWLDYLGEAAACIVDLSHFTLHRRGLHEGEDRLIVASHLAEARRRIRAEVDRHVPRERTLLLPSRLSDEEKVNRSLRFLRCLKLLEGTVPESG